MNRAYVVPYLTRMILSNRSNKEKPFQTNKHQPKKTSKTNKTLEMCSFGSGLLMFLFSITTASFLLLLLLDDKMCISRDRNVETL